MDGRPFIILIFMHVFRLMFQLLPFIDTRITLRKLRTRVHALNILYPISVSRDSTSCRPVVVLARENREKTAILEKASSLKASSLAVKASIMHGVTYENAHVAGK